MTDMCTWSSDEIAQGCSDLKGKKSVVAWVCFVNTELICVYGQHHVCRMLTSYNRAQACLGVGEGEGVVGWAFERYAVEHSCNAVCISSVLSRQAGHMKATLLERDATLCCCLCEILWLKIDWTHEKCIVADWMRCPERCTMKE